MLGNLFRSTLISGSIHSDDSQIKFPILKSLLNLNLISHPFQQSPLGSLSDMFHSTPIKPNISFPQLVPAPPCTNWLLPLGPLFPYIITFLMIASAKYWSPSLPHPDSNSHSQWKDSSCPSISNIFLFEEYPWLEPLSVYICLVNSLQVLFGNKDNESTFQIGHWSDCFMIGESQYLCNPVPLFIIQLPWLMTGRKVEPEKRNPLLPYSSCQEGNVSYTNASAQHLCFVFLMLCSHFTHLVA